jgi:ribonuclease Z
MPTLHLLGTGAAVSDPGRTTTMLAFQAEGGSVLVDCGGDVVQQMLKAGIGADDLDALIVTHEHPDHVSGFPLFMEKIWLMERRRPIPVLGIRAALDQARRVFEAFDTSGWEGMPEIEWREVALEPGAEVLTSDRWRITATPGVHSVPVIALRVQDARGGGVVAYSCDTEKSDAVTALSRGADVLVHEASGGFKGHTSIEDAARVARDAEAGRLILVHLPPDVGDDDLIAAREIFPAVEFGEDGARFDF